MFSRNEGFEKKARRTVSSFKDAPFFLQCAQLFTVIELRAADFQNMHHEGNFVKFTADRGDV